MNQRASSFLQVVRCLLGPGLRRTRHVPQHPGENALVEGIDSVAVYKPIKPTGSKFAVCRMVLRCSSPVTSISSQARPGSFIWKRFVRDCRDLPGRRSRPMPRERPERVRRGRRSASAVADGAYGVHKVRRVDVCSAASRDAGSSTSPATASVVEPTRPRNASGRRVRQRTRTPRCSNLNNQPPADVSCRASQPHQSANVLFHHESPCNCARNGSATRKCSTGRLPIRSHWATMIEIGE